LLRNKSANLHVIPVEVLSRKEQSKEGREGGAKGIKEGRKTGRNKGISK
jgi:hypothetical protein